MRKVQRRGIKKQIRLSGLRRDVFDAGDTQEEAFHNEEHQPRGWNLRWTSRKRSPCR